MDLFVGNEESELYFSANRLFRNDGDGDLSAVASSAVVQEVGQRGLDVGRHRRRRPGGPGQRRQLAPLRLPQHRQRLPGRHDLLGPADRRRPEGHRVRRPERRRPAGRDHRQPHLAEGAAEPRRALPDRGLLALDQPGPRPGDRRRRRRRRPGRVRRAGPERELRRPAAAQRRPGALDRQVGLHDHLDPPGERGRGRHRAGHPGVGRHEPRRVPGKQRQVGRPGPPAAHSCPA